MFRVLLFILSIFSLPAFAQDWAVDYPNSKLGFFATQAGAEFEGGFKKFQSDIAFNPDDLAASKVRIVIDMNSVDTQSADRDANIVNPDWFDTQNHPTAVFETTEIAKAGDGTYIAKANLTMRGVTKVVELPFTVDINGQSAVAKGELTVSRNDYGIGQGQWIATNIIGGDVRIFFDLNATAK